MKKEDVRPVRIKLAMKDGPIPLSIKQVLSTAGNESSFVYVDNIVDADLVICMDMREIEQGFNKERTYAFITLQGGRRQNLPENCIEIGFAVLLVELLKVISSVHQKLKPIAQAPVVMEVFDTVVLERTPYRILVIDDMPAHVTSAKTGLGGHMLKVATGYEEAMSTLGSGKFDVVLTDLHLPMSSKTLGDQAFRLGELVPYGILLMVEAARQGAKYVAVVTDLNHHADPFSAAFDHFSHFPVKIEGAKVVMMHAPMKGDAKDWVEALNQLTKE